MAEIPKGFKVVGQKAIQGIPEGFEIVGRQTPQSQGQDAMRSVAAGLSGPDARLVAMGSAVNDVKENADSAGQFIGEQLGILGPNDRTRLEREQSVDDEAFRALREEQPVNTAVGRGIAQAGMFAAAPGGMAGGLIRRGATGSVSGGATALASTGVDEDPIANLSVGAMFGAGAPFIVQGISNAVLRLTNKPIQVFADGKLTDEALEVIRKNDIAAEQLSDLTAVELRKAGMLTREQADRFNLFQDMGIQPTRAQVTQSGDDFIRQQELAKGTNPLRAQIDEQERVIADFVDGMIERSGGKSTDNIIAGGEVASSIQARINAADTAVDDAYRTVRESLSGDKVVRPSKLVFMLKRMEPQNPELSRSVMSELKLRGLVSDAGNIADRASVDAAEEVRKSINAIIGDDPFKRSRLGKMFKDALDSDVERAVGRDAFAPARQAKARLERSLERTRTTRRDAGKSTLLEEVVQNRANPDKLMGRILGPARAEDVGQVMAFLRSGDQAEIQAGAQAIAEIRSATLRHIYQKAITNSAKTEQGLPMFSGVKFGKELDRIGGKKLKALFDDKTLTDLGSLRRIGELRVPTAGSALGLGPSGRGALEVVNTMADLGDPVNSIFLRLTQGIFRRAKEAGDTRRLMAPAAGLEKQVQKAQRPKVRPFSGSVGAVTADRLIEESEG